MLPSLTNPDNNTFKIPLMLPYREVYYECSLFFQKAKFMEKLVLNVKSYQKPKTGKLPVRCASLKSYLDYPY